MLLQIVAGTAILLIKWEYLDCQKDPEEMECCFTIIPRNNRNNIPDTANTVVLGTTLVRKA